MDSAPGLCASGSTSHAVPVSTTPSMKNFATPHSPQATAFIAKRNLVAHLGEAHSGFCHMRHHDTAGEIAIGLEPAIDIELFR